MDLELTDAQRLIVQNARRIVREEIRPLEDDLDPDADTLPRHDRDRLVAMVKEMGLWQPEVPAEHGAPVSIP